LVFNTGHSYFLHESIFEFGNLVKSGNLVMQFLRAK